MIDLETAGLLLVIGAVVGTLMHLWIHYLGRATLVAWLLVECGVLGWYFWYGETIFGYTTLATAFPIALLILVIGIPFEVGRRQKMRHQGRQVMAAGGFACPHCGCDYDRERERGRCPDCGGAWDGAPGVLG